MKKVAVKIIGLSYSQSQLGSYVAVLSEVKGTKKIPIIIKPSDAQYVALKLESIDIAVPMIHDLVNKIVSTLSAEVIEVNIDNMAEGIFYCKIILKDYLGEKYKIPCGVGDAISLSLSFDCPLYASKQVIDEAGVNIADDGTIVSDESDETPVTKDEKVSIESLEKMLNDAIENEEYEIASQLRDRINSMKLDKKKL